MLENMPSYLPDDLQSLVNRLAARAALLIVSKREHPALVERLSDFIQDRGAVGMLLQIYNDSQTIEKVALSFWQSRTEKSGSRFEDILTTAIIATLSSVVAGILVEMWKGEFGPLKRFLTPNEKDLLRLASRKEPRLRQDVEKILPFYYAKEAGLGVVNAEVAKALYMSLSQGSSFSMFADKNPSAVQNRSKQDFLAYGTQVSRGVVKTELQRALNGLNPQYHSDKKGMTFSDYLSFEEVIPLFDAEDLGLGPNWPKDPL